MLPQPPSTDSNYEHETDNDGSQCSVDEGSHSDHGSELIAEIPAEEEEEALRLQKHEVDSEEEEEVVVEEQDDSKQSSDDGDGDPNAPMASIWISQISIVHVYILMLSWPPPTHPLLPHLFILLMVGSSALFMPPSRLHDLPPPHRTSRNKTCSWVLLSDFVFKTIVMLMKFYIHILFLAISFFSTAKDHP